MEFSVYLCFSIIFCYYGSQTTASQSEGGSEEFFKLLTEYIRSAGGNREGGFQRGEVRGLPLPVLILPVPAASGHTQAQNEDHNFNLGFQSRLGFQQDSSQLNVPKGFSINKQLHNQFTVQNTADGEFSNSNVQKSSGRPEQVIIVKESSRTNKPQLLGLQQNTADGEFSNSHVQKSSGRPEQVYIVKESSRTNKPQLLGLQQNTDNTDGEFLNSNVQKNSRIQEQVYIVKQSSKTNKPQLSDVQQDTRSSFDEFSSSNFEKTSGVPHRTTIIKESSNTDIPPIPQMAATSKDLLRQFHAQFAHLQGEDLPPAVIDKAALEVTYETRFSENQEDGLTGQDQDILNQRPGNYLPAVKTSPPTPKWDFPLKMKAELLVPRAQYTEPYQMWFNSRTGASKIDFHEGGTVTYRMPTRDGRQVKVSKRTNRIGESNIPECIITNAEDGDLSAQGLPDLTKYQFGGYENSEQGTLEKWVYELRGNPGQYGASVQESLTFHHEMIIKRDAKNTIPVNYSVKIDSSLLGANCDGYSHRYFDVEDLHEDDESQFNFDIDANCQRKETGDVTNPVHRIHLEPLHEFTLPGRDERYDSEIVTFKTQNSRNYMDNTEEAMRKNLFIQHSRFIMSGNRESATFELEMNFLGDRLEAELSLLRGVSWQSADDIQGGPDEIEQFPHPEPMVRNLSKKLPKEFDWRPLGAVSHVRYQGSCSACWAFAVAGAVEGALFVQKRRLVPLSEQCLVDCGKPFGTHGCKGTWPRFAYNYVKARGLPALDEYPPYIEKEQTCRKPASDPITHISAYVNVTQNSVPSLQIAIRRHSPTVVIVDGQAHSFVFYKRGVLYDDRCGKALPKLNHAVLAVGWGDHRRTPYFILKNSWSAAWGEQGYIKVQGPANTCGVLTQPSYPRLEESDVDRLP